MLVILITRMIGIYGPCIEDYFDLYYRFTECNLYLVIPWAIATSGITEILGFLAVSIPAIIIHHTKVKIVANTVFVNQMTLAIMSANPDINKILT